MPVLAFSASCRHDFTSSWDIDILRSIGEFPEHSRVVVLVHGYKNSYVGAEKAYRQITDRMTGVDLPYHYTGGFYWPGSRLNLGFLAAAKRADSSGIALAQLIADLQRKGNTVSVETHSLGARVALSALRAGAKVEHLILTAPAVDDDCLQLNGEFAEAAKNARWIAICHSPHDRVLKYAYRFSELVQRVNPRRALGLYGPVGSLPPNAFTIVCKDVKEHGGYKDSTAFFQNWRAIA
jgi:esterase/lipase superfamily enzyme